MRRKLLLSVVLFISLFCSGFLYAQTTIRSINFETDGSGYTVTNGFRDNDNKYWRRFDKDDEGTGGSDDHAFQNNVTGVTGDDFYFAGEDLDLDCSITSTSIDVTSFHDLDVQLKLAAPGENYDNGTDYIIIEYSFNGTTFTRLTSFTGAGAESVFREDTDNNGVGEGTQLTAALQTFTYTIPKLGTSLYVKITARNTGAGEEFVIDNILVRGNTDNTAPTVTSINRASATPTNATAVDFTVVFSEVVTGVGTGDFTKTGSANGAVSNVSGSGTTYTVTVNTVSGDGTLGLDAKTSAGGATIDDLAANDFTAGFTTGQTYTIDNTSPTAAITYDDADGVVKAGQVLRITATFNEPVKDAPIMQMSLSGANTLALTNMTKTSSTVYYYDYTVSAGNGSVTVALGTGTDLAGNVVTAAPTSGASFTVDNTAPTAAITYDDADAVVKAGQVIRITATFNEPVHDAPVMQISLSGANVLALTGMTKTSSTVYYYDHTVGAGDGAVTVALGTGTDLGGNVITAAPTSGATFTVDNTGPVADITYDDADGIVKTGDVIKITATFNEPVDDAPVMQLSLSGANTLALTDMTKSSATVYYYDHTVAAGNGTVTVALGTGTDALDNVVTATPGSGATFSVDNTGPTAAITYDDTDGFVKAGQVLRITATFNEPVADAPVMQISLSGTNTLALTDMTKSSATVYYYDHTVGSGDGTVTVALGTGTDDLGNVVTAAPTSGATFTVDNTAPTAAITYDDADGVVKAGDVIRITATFNEPVLDAPVMRVSLSGANTLALTNMTKSSATVYYYDHTVTAGNGTVTVALGTGTDRAGNTITSTPTSGATFTVDNTAPTAAITYDDADGLVKAGQVLRITATFNEPVKDSPVMQVSLSGGNTLALTNMTKSSTTVYYYDHTVAAGNGTVTVALGTGTDGAANLVTATPTSGATFTVDNTAPTAAITYDDADGVVKAGQVLRITATFNEPVNDAPVMQINLSGTNTLALTDMTKSSSTVYYYDHTVGTGNGTVTVALGTGTDVVGNIVTATPTSGATFTVDNTAPTAAITYDDADGFVKAGQVLRITATFNEPVSDAPVMQISLSGTNTLALTNMTKTSSTVYYYDHTVGTGNGTVTVALGTGTDLGSNVITSAPTSGSTFTVDNTAPTAAITYNDADGIVKAGQVVRITATFNEPISDAPVMRVSLSGSNTLALTNMTKTSSTVYYYDHTVGAGNGTVTVALGTGTDRASNVITATPTSGATFTVDNTAPTAAITYNDADGFVKAGQVLRITATFNEPVNDSPVMQISLSGTNTLALTNMTKSSSTVYYYDHTVGAGNGTVTVALGTGTDIATNTVNATPTSGATFVVDNTAPTAAITYNDADALVRAGQVIRITATFSEAIADAPVMQISLSGTNTLALTNMIKSSTTVYYYDHTVGAGDGTVTVAVGTGVDRAGNVITSTPTSGATFTVDNTPPVVTDITLLSTNPNNTSSVQFQVKFSPDVSSSGVNAADFATFGTASGSTLIGVSGSGNTYTVTISNITLTGNLGLSVKDDNSITDGAGNPLGGTLIGDGDATGPDEYAIVFPEPSRHVTGFQIDPSVTDYTKLKVTWTDAIGSPTPSGYLIVVKRGSSSPSHPVDGTPVTDQLNLIPAGNTIGYMNVSHVGGANQAEFSSLLSAENYTFWIYPYTNGGSTIDYKTDADVFTPLPLPSASASTLVDDGVWINNSSPVEPASFPSTTTNSGAAVVNFRFQVYDHGWSSPDNASTKITQIRIRRDLVNDEIGNWFNALQAVELTSGAITKTGTIDPGGDFITFSGLYNGTTEFFGEVADNTAKYYSLKLILRTNMGGSLPLDIDNKSFVFVVRNIDLTLAPNSSHLNAGNDTHPNAPSSGIGTNKVTVEATQLDFTIQPPATGLVLSNLSATPVIKARDVHGNVDVDYDATLALTNADGLPMRNATFPPTSITSISMTDGVATFPLNFQYGDDGNGTLTATSSTNAANGSIPSAALSSTVTINYSNTSTITAGTFTEPPTFSSVTDETTAYALNSSVTNTHRVFDFRVVDDGGSGGDGSPTRIPMIKVFQGTGNDVSDWRQIIFDAKLYDGINEMTGVVNETDITFSGINTTTLGFVGDNATKNYQLYIRLKETMDGTLPVDVDNLNLVFSVSDDNDKISLATLSSTFTGSEDENSGASNVAIDVDASHLRFIENPEATLLASKDISLQQTDVPSVEAVDRNGNRDEDFNSATVTVTNTGSLTMANLPANNAIVSGLLTFPNNFQLTSVGTNVTLAVAATGPTVVLDATSTPFNVRVGISGTITAGAAVPATISSLDDTDPEKVKVFEFTINDDPAGTPAIENDGNPMLVDEIKITQQGAPHNTIADWSEAIAVAILTDGTTSHPGTVGVDNITFSGIPTGTLGLISDNGSKTYQLFIYLKPSMLATPPATIDGEKFGFKVAASDIKTLISGTSIKSTEGLDPTAGTAVTVQATQLVFIAGTAASINVPFSVSVEARDVNGNRDKNFTGANAQITAFGTEVSVNADVPELNDPAHVFTDGIYNFPGNFQYTAENGTNNDGELTMTAGKNSLASISGTSHPIDITSSSESILKFDPNFNYTINIPYVSKQNNANMQPLAGYLLTDGDGTNNDTDGAPTSIESITFSVTTNGLSGSSDIRNLALFDHTDALIESKSLSGGSVTFSGLSDTDITTGIDFASTTFTLRASFKDSPTDVHDHDQIQVSITNVVLNGGSQLNPIGGVTGVDVNPGTGAVAGAPLTPNDRNIVDVVATRLDFTTQPNAFEGIKQLLVTTPVVKARDANGIVDLDHDFAATLSTPGGAASLSNTSFVFVDGEVTLSGLQYNSTGVGTIKVTSGTAPVLASDANGSISCIDVDVINTASTLATGGVISSPNLPGGAVNRVIFGVTITAPHFASGEPKLEKFIISFSNPITNVLKNYRVFESTDGTNDGNDVDVTGSIGAVLTTAATSLTIDFSGGSPRSLNAPLTYFLMVDVEPTASGSTPKIQPIVYNDASHIFVTQGSVWAPIAPPPVSSSATLGKEYSFASIFPPTLTSSYPASGQLNVDPDQPTIDLVFSVPVWSLDREILLYDKEDETFVSLPALNGNPAGGSAALAGTNANPLRFDLPALLPDRVYYITIAPGKKAEGSDPGDGIVDESSNEFPGFSYSGTLYFKTANPNPPQLLAANVTNASGNGAVLNARFDQRGDAYFMVVPHGAAAPSNAEIKGTAITYLGPVLDRGTFKITQTMSAWQFGLIDANLSLSTNYDVYMYAENDALPAPIPTSDPYGTDFVAGHAGPTLVFTTASSNPPTGPIVSSNSFCKDGYQPLSSPILIVENGLSDFSAGNTNDQVFNLLLPTGFQFDISLTSGNQPQYGTLVLSGSDFIGSGSLKFINNSTLQVKYKNNGGSSRDQIAITGLRVIATTATSGDIVRLGGNAITLVMPDLTVLGKLNSFDASTQIIATNFTNSYTVDAYNSNLVTTIPDDYNRPSFNVELIPVLNEGDYGPSSFTGAGVNVNQLNLSAVTKNTPFNITHTHTDNNGCISKISAQYTVYDHTSAIKGLSLAFCAKNPDFPGAAPVDYPSLIQEVKFNNLAAHQMYNLTAKVPFDADPLSAGTEKSQIIHGSGWQTVLDDLPFMTEDYPDPNDITRIYKDYKIDAAKILNASGVPAPYSYFDETTPQNNIYYTGGSLGFVEFTGEYQNIANASVEVPLKQNVQFFLPAIPVVELTGWTFMDENDPSNPVGDGGPSNKGTPVFCQEGGLININAYPAAAVGSSIGTFKLFDVATNLEITPPDGFTDNGNGTAILDPTKVWNNFTDIRIVYTYKDNDSPCDGTGYQVIRIAPNPVAKFTALSANTPNTPVATAYCENMPVNFDAEESEISNGAITLYRWDFNDATNSTGGNLNVIEGDKATAGQVSHRFIESAEYHTSLVVTSNYGCASNAATKDLPVGAVPEMNFLFDGVSTNDQIRFTNTSAINSAATVNDGYQRLDWSYGHGSPENTPDHAKVMNHQYPTAGKFNANLKITSVLGCVNELTKQVVVVPHVPLDDTKDAYFANFEADSAGYQDLSGTGGSSWQWGSPAAGTVIGSATDGNNRIWSTSPNGTYNPDERSALYTAAFDIANLVRPIITFNSFRNLGQGDGVVLEYSVDNYNVADDDRKVWKRLGEIKSTTLTSSGVNWYNGLSLPSKPGEQESGDNGWTGMDLEWRASKHSLAEIPKAARNKVVFRFALASVSDEPVGDGFAIDEVRVGNGTRTVLIENFTNTASTDASVKVVSDTLKNFQKGNEVGLEVIKLNYHVAFPGEDPFNIQNPVDPGARALYYGVSTVPQTRLDGTFSSTPGPLFSQWGRPEFDSRILDLANAKIQVNADIVDGALTITGTFEPLLDLTRPTILHVAVVEKNISQDNNPELGSGRIKSGETDFEYVVRKMLPNGAGTKYSTPITEGQTVQFGPFTWANATLYKPQDDIAVIVFLQDEDSKVIYQSFIKKDINDPGIVTGIEDRNASFNVYPIPADREMTVELPASATQRTTLRMYDQLGKVVEESFYEIGDSKKTIGTESLAGGVYLIQIETSKGILRRKVMVTHRN